MIMISPTTLTFLTDLKANNHKPWFEEHRKTYEAARTNVLQVVQQLIDELSEMDPAIEAAQLEAKQCMMRIYRDVRFFKDKSPYKTNFFAYMSQGGRKGPYAGYYLSVAPEEAFCGGGMYRPDHQTLGKVRAHIDRNLSAWEQIVTAPTLVDTYGNVKPSGQLKRPPKGYSADHPAVEWLKFKGFYTQKMLSAQQLQAEGMAQQVMAAFRKARPLVDFINEALE